MIDIHCHILPDFDDGASSMDESLEMARMALLSGVTELIATPHFRGESEHLDQLEEIDRRYQELADAVKKWKIPVKLHKGAEVLCTQQTQELAKAGKLPTLGNTKYVLTEFYFDETFGFMDQCLTAISIAGYTPVIAHPERYNAIQRDPVRVQRWTEWGFVLQLNKGSLLGSFGSRTEDAAHDLLGLGLAHIIASDAHSCHSRTPHMGGLLEWAEEFCDPECVRIMLTENPQRLLKGLPMAGYG